MVTPKQYDELIMIEFNLENLEERLAPRDSARPNIRRALQELNRAAKKGRSW